MATLTLKSLGDKPDTLRVNTTTREVVVSRRGCKRRTEARACFARQFKGGKPVPGGACYLLTTKQAGNFISQSCSYPISQADFDRGAAAGLLLSRTCN